MVKNKPKCSVCKGTGKNNDNTTCRACNGSGQQTPDPFLFKSLWSVRSALFQTQTYH